jgi:hypothetical protein
MTAFFTVWHSSNARASSAGHSRAPSCEVRELDTTAGLRGGAGFAHADCADGWALAVGARGSGAGAALFHKKSDRWVELRQSADIAEANPSGRPTATPLEYAGIGTGISPTLLQELSRPYPAAIRREADAGALVEELATYESRIGAPGSYQASAVITAHGKAWLVTEGADSAISSSPAANASPYPNGVVAVYRWTTRGWTEQGTVRGWFGPVGECCGILAESLTGSSDPDFALTGGGAADTNWLAVVSDAGGQWHAVPFNYGYSDTTVVNGEPKGRGIMTWVDATSAAFGPTTSLCSRRFSTVSSSPPPHRVLRRRALSRPCRERQTPDS